jgi:branched-chain amino acid transport system permease protein
VIKRLPFLGLVCGLALGLITPLLTGASSPGFWLEVLLGGLMAGVLYALVALGFVLIFKASGVFNFAQGAMVLFSALAVARLSERLPLWLAVLITLMIMILLAVLIERLVLRPLVNQSGVTLLMATLGVAYVLEGLGQTVWGSDIYSIDVGIPREPMLVLETVFPGGILLNRDDLAAAGGAIALVGALVLLFRKSKTGLALRAVAGDPQAAQSVGISLRRIWVTVWSIAGGVATVTGVVWGGKLGVQFSLALIALKALPVVILGGFTSIPGAILGGLIVGVGEKMAEVFLGPQLVRAFELAGGGIENWFAYVLALLFLLVRPEGLFGERHINRV